MSVRQRGFTLIELMAATVAGAVVILAATSFLLTVLRWYDEINSRIALNRHARETYDVMAYGGISSTVGHDGSNYFYSIRGMHNSPGNGMRQNYAFQYKSNNLTITPDLFGTMTVTCVSAGNPLPDCGGSTPPNPPQTKNVSGWLASDMTFDSGAHSVNHLTAQVVMTMMNPYEIQRAFAPAQFIDTYRTIFTMNRNESDP